MDFGPVHLLTTGALAELAGQLERTSVDESRFRPNLVLEASRDPVPGQVLRSATSSCGWSCAPHAALCPASRTREQPMDRQLLSALAKHHGPAWATWAGRRASACTQRSYAQVSSSSARSSGSRSLSDTAKVDRDTPS